MGLLSNLFGRRNPVAPSLGRVEFDDVRVIFRYRDRTDTLEWDDLSEVGIVTTDEGPFQEDVYFMLLGPNQEKGCAIPQGAEGSQQLFERLQKLPDFDHDAAIRAMGSTSNNRFVCWKKQKPNQAPQTTTGSSAPDRV